MNNIFSIANKSTCPPPDEFVLIDTSVMLEIIGHDPTTNRTKEVKDFLLKLAQNNNIIVTSAKTWEELNLFFEGNIAKIEGLRKNKGLLFEKQNMFDSVNQQMTQVKEIFSALPNVYSNPIGFIDNKIIQMAETNRSKYNLRWGDSIILAIAEDAEISHLWSLDSDYARVNSNMSIYLDSNSYNKALGYTNGNSILKNTMK